MSKQWKTARIDRHCNALGKLLNSNDSEKNYRAYKRLRRIEMEAERCAVAYCEVDNYDWERAVDNIKSKVKRVFNGSLPLGFFVNGDPRGYALKIATGESYEKEYHPEYIPEGMHKDWGGFGILAPDFSE